MNTYSRAFPIEGTSGAGSDRWAIFSPTCGTGGLNLVTDVLAQLLQVGIDVGGLEFHDYGAQAVVAAHYGDTRFPDPIAVIEQVAARTMLMRPSKSVQEGHRVEVSQEVQDKSICRRLSPRGD